MEFLKILSLSLALSISSFAMKHGMPFRFNIISFVRDVSFGREEAPITFPAGNGMREEDMLFQLRKIAICRYQSAINTGLANSFFNMSRFQQLFDLHIRHFSSYIFREHRNYSHELYERVEYLYGDGLYVASTRDEKIDSDHVGLLFICRNLDVSQN